MTVQSPFAGSSVLVQVGVAPGNVLPTKVVISTSNSGKPPSTNENCGSSGASVCQSTNGAQPFTVQDVESIGGLGQNVFTTLTLLNPVTIGGGVWVNIDFLAGTSSPSGILDQCDASGCGNGGAMLGIVQATCLSFGTSNPVIGNTYTTVTPSNCMIDNIVGGSFLPAVGSVGTFTQCLGNCGTPAVTLVNTNSTHTINFNQSITLFYQFQSNVNGFILNATTNVATSYNTAGKTNQITVGIYEVASCPSGNAPFSPQCPGTLLRTGGTGNPTKGRISVPGPLAVNNGQWVGIAVTAAFSGMDLNDTNTSVPMLVTTGNGAGFMPQIIQQANPFNSCSCKIGLWAWLNGNTVGGPPSTIPGTGGFCDLTCSFLTIIGFGFGTNLLAGGIFYWIIFFLLGSVALYKLTEGHFPAGAYVLYGVMLVFIFSAMGIFPVWVPIVVFLIVALMASGVLGNLLTGNRGGSSKL
jgi:hypothetical protein